MKVLFVSSAKKGEMHHGTRDQMESIQEEGVQTDFFLVNSKGIRGYMSNIIPLRKKCRDQKYDLIHAIGGHCGLLCLIGLFSKKKIVSFLGSDIQRIKEKRSSVMEEIFRKIIVFCSFFYSQIIVKSERMLNVLPEKVHNKSNVIPNGVDFSRFKPMDKIVSRCNLELKAEKFYILFLGDTRLKNKNFDLVQKAYSILNHPNIELLSPFPVDNTLIPVYINSADILLLTSFSEGSPNVIKEAMACNCPIISTDVGDVKENFGNIEGCVIIKNDPQDLANKIRLILKNNRRTNAREHISYLDKRNIAKRIIEVYNRLI
jgi:teichuronic acid biosynthesis glycosyltransferase TuaC